MIDDDDEFMEGIDEIPDQPPKHDYVDDGAPIPASQVIEDLSWLPIGVMDYDQWEPIMTALGTITIIGPQFKMEIALAASRGEYDRFKRGGAKFDSKTEQEIATLWKNKPKKEGGIGYGTIKHLVRLAQQAETFNTWREWAEQHGEEYAERHEQEEAADQWESFEPFEFKDRPLIQWVIHDLVRESCSHIDFGPSETMKTFKALDLLGSLVTGIKAFNHFEVPSPGDAVFFCDEDPDTVMIERWPAWCHARGIKAYPNPWIHPGRLLVLPRCPSIGSPADVKAAITHINKRGLKPKFVVIDTLAASLGGLDEDSSMTATCAAQALKMFRQAWPRCAGWYTHHTLKYDGKVMRGSSGFMNNFDIVLNSSRSEHSLDTQWTWAKMKSRAKPAAINFKGELFEVPGQMDEQGRQLLAPVFRYSGFVKTEQPISTKEEQDAFKMAVRRQAVVKVLVDHKFIWDGEPGQVPTFGATTSELAALMLGPRPTDLQASIAWNINKDRKIKELINGIRDGHAFEGLAVQGQRSGMAKPALLWNASSRELEGEF